MEDEEKMVTELNGGKKVCSLAAVMTVLIPSTTLVLIVVLIVLGIRCHAGMVSDEQMKGNVLCPAGSDSSVMMIRLCFSVLIMTLVSGIMTLCAWHLWTKQRRQIIEDQKQRIGIVEELKVMVPVPEVPQPQKLLLPKDMSEHLCMAA